MMICIDVMVELGLAETVPGAVRGQQILLPARKGSKDTAGTVQHSQTIEGW